MRVKSRESGANTTAMPEAIASRGAAAVAIPLPGEPAVKAALDPAPFPNRMSAYVWRNWFCVPRSRLASVVGATEADLAAVAVQMGLPAEPAVEGAWARKGYITVIRRNWHLLDYPQLMALVGKSREDMRFALLEDDFLFVKLGRIKPKCGPLVWDARELGDEQLRAERGKIARILREEGADTFSGDEPRFSFVQEYASAQANTPAIGHSSGAAPFDLRLIFSYFADYGDPLGDPEIGSYPEGLLARLASQGVNAVWLHTVLRTLGRDPKYPEFGEGSERRLENLRTLVARAARHGIRVYLYLNEPRAMPEAFFAAVPARAAIKGTKGRTGFSICTSAAETRRWLADAVEQVFRAAPGLGGVFTITASENQTSCASHPGMKEGCPRCRRRSREAIIAEVNRAIIEGMTRAAPGAEALVWDWGWPDPADSATGSAEKILARLPKRNVRLMRVSEWGMPFERGGVTGRVEEYSLSCVGPSRRSVDVWRAAKAAGVKTCAKVQTSVSWELSPFPYLPVMDLVAEHAEKLAAAGADGVMLSWSLGCALSPNLRVYREFRGSAAATLDFLAADHYGQAAAPAVRRAWTAFSNGFRNYPFAQQVVYCGPRHMGPANPLYAEPTGWEATMVGLPYDDLKRWRSIYPAETWIQLMDAVAQGFETGCRLFAEAIGVMPPETRAAAEKELGLFRAETLHLASAADQARFIAARDAGEAKTMRAVTARESDRARTLLALAAADSRIGYECSNHYFYLPQDLREKIVRCRLAAEGFPVTGRGGHPAAT